MTGGSRSCAIQDLAGTYRATKQRLTSTAVELLCPNMVQTEMALPEAPAKRRGGPGRTPVRKGTWMKHRPRPWHDEREPVHVTLRVRRHVPSLRGFKLAKVITDGLRVAATSQHKKKQDRRRTFRVVHYSIQANHLHLLVEATSKTALARGMQGLASGLARRVNRRLGRKGALFADRYHAHALSSPSEVRNALVYVLKNYQKHQDELPDLGTAPVRGVDPCSSAPWFRGWASAEMPASVLPAPVVRPQTWLLSVGWKRVGGAISAHERPARRPG
jgi:REP element-mobilizing transposase RayT